MFYACMFTLILCLLVLLGVAAGYLTLRKAVSTWTDTQPIALPTVAVSKAEADRLQQLVGAFENEVKSGQPAPPLALSANDINGLIASSPDFKAMRGKLHVDIHDGKAQGQISLPLDQTGATFFKGRYLNGVGTIKASLKDGLLRITLEEVRVKDKPVPDVLMTRLAAVNFAQKLNEDPNASAMIRNLKGVKFNDDKLLLVPKNTSP